MAPVPHAYDLDDPAVASAIDDVPLWSAPFGLALLEAVRLGPDLRALDVGSGLGFPAIELAQRIGPAGRVIGLDPWLVANRRARDKIAAWGLENVTIVDGRAEAMPFAEASFDLIVSNNGTNNVDDERQVYREIARVARPGAQVVLTFNLPETMVEFYDVYREVLVGRGQSGRVADLEDHILHKRKPVEHVRAAVTDAGLEVVAVRHAAFRLRYAGGTAMLGSPLIRLAFRPAWEALLAPEQVAPVFADIAAELDRRAATVGELSLNVPWVLLEARRG